ncbi:MAG TPA: hypothetical protein VE621_11695, partial [Bryobacteraceae bacterium]|nr:hypothetical protein [Bryobacteraceae bacterium]
AHAIVVASMSTRLESSELVSFDLTMERVLKGDESLKVAHVSHPWKRRGLVITDQPNSPINVTIRGIWFLQRTGSGDWDVLAANGADGMMMNLYLPAAETPPERYGSQASLTPLDATIIEFTSGAEQAGSWRRAMIVELLKNIRTPAVSRVTSAYLSSPDPQFQIAGLALGLAQNQKNVLSDLSRLWPTASSDPGRVDIVNSLRNSYRDVSPDSVKELAAIAADPTFAELRAPAVRALASIHTKEALSMLAGLLQSSDSDERMKGVFGLSSFANGCPVQTPENVVSMEYLQFSKPSPYRTPETIAHFAFRSGPAEQEAELISFWRNWWIEHQAELMK